MPKQENAAIFNTRLIKVNDLKLFSGDSHLPYEISHQHHRVKFLWRKNEGNVSRKRILNAINAFASQFILLVRISVCI